MSHQIIKVALLGKSNLGLLAEELHDALHRWMPMFEFQLYQSEFGQLRQEIIDKNSALYQYHADFCWCCDWFEDFYDPFFDGPLNAETALSTYREHLQLIQHFSEHFSGKIYINQPAALLELNTLAQTASLQQTCQELLLSTFPKHLSVTCLAFEDLLKSVSPVIDPRFKLLGRIPFSGVFHTALSNTFAGYLAQPLGKSIRLIVVDLDHTLWGGVLGEDGISGIQIGGDYPGNCYSAFQYALLGLKHRGIPLAIASKNDLCIVESAFKERQMPLQLSDFIAIQANWNHKAQNIQEIAQAIGIDFCNILFIDDSSVECAAAAAACPRLHILHLPAEPTEYLEALNNIPLLRFTDVHAADKTRAASYQQRQQWLEAKTHFDDLESFYRSLNLTLYLAEVNENTVQRAAQLFSKTTQFNLTGKRYSIEQLLQLKAQGHWIMTIEVADTYSNREMMGAVVILKDQQQKTHILDNYVMSCRALGKQAEKEALKALLLSLKPGKMIGRCIPTERNLPAQDLFSDLNFDYDPNLNIWESPQNKQVTLSDWVTIIDQRHPTIN